MLGTNENIILNLRKAKYRLRICRRYFFQYFRLLIFGRYNQRLMVFTVPFFMFKIKFKAIYTLVPFFGSIIILGKFFI